MRALCQSRSPLSRRPTPLRLSLSQAISPASLMAARLAVTQALTPAVILAVILIFSSLPQPARATEIGKREGWVIFESEKSYETLLRDLSTAVKAEGLVVVTQAGPTQAAAARGISIPGNRVVGVFNNDYAVRVLALSTAAMIEAPIRFYVTEAGADHSHLAYKRPSFVLAPYVNEGGGPLLRISAELDRRFAAIARKALR